MSTFGAHGVAYLPPIVVHRVPIRTKKSPPKPAGVQRDIALCMYWLVLSIPAAYMLCVG